MRKHCWAAAFLISLVASLAVWAPPAFAWYEDVEGVEVPEEALVIDGGELKGVRRDWVDLQGARPTIKVPIPAGVTRIADDAFGPDNPYAGCAGNGDYELVAIDFEEDESDPYHPVSHVSSLGDRCFMGNDSLVDRLLLSHTEVVDIGDSAFSGCSSLEIVLFPGTLETIGDRAFFGCSGIGWLDTPDNGGLRRLPQGLRSIGASAFEGALDFDFECVLPKSVDAVGPRAFDSDKIHQIVVERDVGMGSGYAGYDEDCFGDTVYVILPDYDSYKAFTPVGMWAYPAFPTKAQFIVDGNIVRESDALAGLSFGMQRELKNRQFSFWKTDFRYSFPDTAPYAKPGYTMEWCLDDDTVVALYSQVPADGPDPVRVTLAYVPVEPVVTPSLDGLPVPFLASDGEFSFDVSPNPADPSAPRHVGVTVDHPLLKGNYGDESDYVYFRYAWWDEKDGTAAGPRSALEPGLFSQDLGRRIVTDSPSVPIYDPSDARVLDDRYMVEVYGYHVVNGREELFYKSAHNLDGFGYPADADATSVACYRLEVKVGDWPQSAPRPVPPPAPEPDPVDPAPQPAPEPTPTPAPDPEPGPAPLPSPEPDPTPGDPDPAPVPDPDPLPGSGGQGTSGGDSGPRPLPEAVTPDVGGDGPGPDGARLAKTGDGSGPLAFAALSAAALSLCALVLARRRLG